MTNLPPDGQPPAEGVAPPPYTPVNNDEIPVLPPIAPPSGYPRPGYWAVPPQPQAPGWPYAGVPPYTAVPPFMAGPPVAPRDEIGPNRVPWRFWDVLIAGSPFVFILLLSLAAHFAPTTATSATTDAPISTRLLVANAVIGLVVYVVILSLVWAVTVRKYRVGWSALGIRRPPGVWWALIIPIILGIFIASAIATAIVVNLFYGGNATNPQLKEITGGGGFSWTNLVIALITASIAAPVVEEIFFRGVLYGWLRTRWGSIAAVIIDGALFSGAHAIPLILASIFIVGLTLAIVYEKTKSTIATMTLHSLFNTIGVVTVFIDLARK